jgi:hypothetical protein
MVKPLSFKERQMTDEEKMIHLGTASEEILRSDSFNTVVNTLVENSFNSFVSTAPDETEKRTAVYYQYRALRDVIDTMHQMVSVRDEIRSKTEQQAEEE